MVEEEKRYDTADYAKAFEALEKNKLLPKNHRALLQAHFQAFDHTASFEHLAEAVGYSGSRAVNLQYGILAHRIGNLLDPPTKPPRGAWIFLLVDWGEPARDSRGFTAFELRPPAIEALKQLGILEGDPCHISLDLLENELAREVRASLALSSEKRKRLLRQAPKLPEKKVVLTTTFVRNPNVIAEVLTRAQGVCEECHGSAPFFRASDGTPYLEVHHRKRLAEGGEDTVKNAIALCPNCHREAHYG